jgi:hypothetical protein
MGRGYIIQNGISFQQEWNCLVHNFSLKFIYIYVTITAEAFTKEAEIAL